MANGPSLHGTQQKSPRTVLRFKYLVESQPRSIPAGTAILHGIRKREPPQSATSA